MRRFSKFLGEELKPLPGTQYGSNPGGVHLDTDTNERHYVKHYRNPDQCRAESLAGKIYEHLGVPTLKPEHKVVNGKDAVVTKWDDNMKPMKAKDFHKTSEDDHVQIGRMYHAAVLTKNWDALGLEHDNVMRHGNTGKLHNVDLGGVFHFRAQGGPKDYGSDIDDHKSLRQPGRPAGDVFNHAFNTTPHAETSSLDRVRSMDHDKVHDMFRDSGLKNWKGLHKSFVDRRQKLLDHYDGK